MPRSRGGQWFAGRLDRSFCHGPRSVEVTYLAVFNEGPFPGDQYLADEAADTCRDAFEGYVGIPPGQSQYDFSWIVPTEETWATGSRHGICLVIPGEGGSFDGRYQGIRGVRHDR